MTPADLQALIDVVDKMMAESGNPNGFDAEAWVRNWLECPIPALNHAKPVDLMDTAVGRAQVMSLLAQMQSGAYA